MSGESSDLSAFDAGFEIGTELTAPGTLPAEIFNPVDGSIVDLADTDSLIDALELLKKGKRDLDVAIRLISLGLLEKVKGLETKTRRVRGQRRRAKLEMPGKKWDQSKLKEVWHSYPALRDQLLRIGHVEVKLTEFNKAKSESGPADFQTCVKMIQAAEREPFGIPSITIEDDVEGATNESVNNAPAATAIEFQAQARPRLKAITDRHS